MTKTVIEILEAVELKLEPHGAWCQNAAARNQQGESVPVNSHDACSWCLMGALAAVKGDNWGREYFTVKGLIRQAITTLTGMQTKDVFAVVQSFNDTRWRTKVEIFTVIQKAKELAGR